MSKEDEVSALGRGGRRPGAGRKPEVSGAERKQRRAADLKLAQARADREERKALLEELEYKREVGSVYDKAEADSTIGEVVALFADQVRSIPDKLERKVGLTPEQAEKSEQLLNAELLALKKRVIERFGDGRDTEAR